MGILVTCLITEKKSLSLKLIMGASIFQLSFVKEAYLIEVFLGGNVDDVSVDYNAIDKSDILNIHK